MKARFVVGCDGARSGVRAADRRRARRRGGQSGLGRDGRARGHRFSRRAPQGGDPVGERRQRAHHSARGRLSVPHLHRARQDQQERARVGPQSDRRQTRRRRAAHSGPLYARGEGNRLVVGLRDRPAHLRQVRRRPAGRRAHPARVCRRRRLPHPQPQGRPGHERFDAGRLQSRLEARGGAARPGAAGVAAFLRARAPAGGAGPHRLRPRMGGDVLGAAAGPVAAGRSGRRSRGVPALFRQTTALHRRRRDAISPVRHLRRA